MGASGTGKPASGRRGTRWVCRDLAQKVAVGGTGPKQGKRQNIKRSRSGAAPGHSVIKLKHLINLEPLITGCLHVGIIYSNCGSRDGRADVSELLVSPKEFQGRRGMLCAGGMLSPARSVPLRNIFTFYFAGYQTPTLGKAGQGPQGTANLVQHTPKNCLEETSSQVATFRIQCCSNWPGLAYGPCYLGSLK